MHDRKPILWHITISHYSEKARWALAHKSIEHERRSPPPSSHILVALWLTGGRSITFPVLELEGERIGDSTAIIAALEARFPDPPLYPEDPGQRRRALDLEDWFDEQLGPAIRRFVFHELRKDPEFFAEVAASAMPASLARAKRVTGAYARAFTAVRFGAGNADAAERARIKVVEAFDRLEAELGDGEYLVGDRFTVADLTAAALFYPVVLPPEGPLALGSGPERLERFREGLRDRPGYRWVEEMFRRHRHRERVPAEAAAG